MRLRPYHRMYLDVNTDGKPRDNRMTAIVIAFLAAGLLIFAGLSRHWLGQKYIGSYFGPRGCEGCGRIVNTFSGDAPPNMTNGQFIAKFREMITHLDEMGMGEARYEADKMTNGAFAPMGWITFAMAIISAVSLAVAAVLALQEKRPDLPVAPTTIALISLVIGMITACVFVATKPLGSGAEAAQAGLTVGVQYGFAIYGAGMVLGIAAAQMLAKVLRPVDPDLLDGAMQPDAY